MCQLRHAQELVEELACPHVTIVTHRPAQTGPVESARALLHAIEYLALGFRQRIEIVDEIDQQKLAAERLGKVRLHPKREFAAAQLKFSMPFVIVNHGLIVELVRPDAQAVVCGVEAQDIVAGQIMQTATMQALLGERTPDRHGAIPDLRRPFRVLPVNCRLIDELYRAMAEGATWAMKAATLKAR